MPDLILGFMGLFLRENLLSFILAFSKNLISIDFFRINTYPLLISSIHLRTNSTDFNFFVNSL